MNITAAEVETIDVVVKEKGDQYHSLRKTPEFATWVDVVGAGACLVGVIVGSTWRRPASCSRVDPR